MVKIKWLIIATVIINAAAIFSPVLNTNDAILYALIAKHIAISNNWIDLIVNQQDWLDKPHFPFWVAAFFFKLFGIHAFAYVLPGFLFHLLGAYYTYKLAKYLYNEEVAWLSVLIYVSVLRLLLSDIDVRAEAYLLGEIMPACYYWLRYHAQFKLKYLLLGAVFTALAMMTKGIFILITIGSGLICLWIYNYYCMLIPPFAKRSRESFRSPVWQKSLLILLFQRGKLFKWLAALLLSFLFTAPELIALYLQFDLHPEKIIFGHSHVSGIKFFFWDSQFGRFFNTGPIQNGNGYPLFFIHTFLWTFLPWTFVFIAAIYNAIKNFKLMSSNNRANFIYLASSFLITFVLFSATKFQLDYYINIIFPFAAIICANYLFQLFKTNLFTHPLYILQISIATALMILTLALSIYIFNAILLVSVVISSLLIIFCMWKIKSQANAIKALVYPVLAINLVFICISLITSLTYIKYDMGYNIAKKLQSQPILPLYDYQPGLKTLAFDSPFPYTLINNLQTLQSTQNGFYLTADKKQLPMIVKLFPQTKTIATFHGLTGRLVLFTELVKLMQGKQAVQEIYLLQIANNNLYSLPKIK